MKDENAKPIDWYASFRLANESGHRDEVEIARERGIHGVRRASPGEFECWCGVKDTHENWLPFAKGHKQGDIEVTVFVWSLATGWLSPSVLICQLCGQGWPTGLGTTPPEWIFDEKGSMDGFDLLAGEGVAPVHKDCPGGFDSGTPRAVTILGSITEGGMRWYIDCEICGKAVSEKVPDPDTIRAELLFHRASHGEF